MYSYTPPSYLHQQQPTPPHYTSATPPAPPPKPSSIEARGPPPPPLPGPNEPSELDGNQTHPNYDQYRHQQNAHTQYQQPQPPTIPAIEPGWLPSSVREKTTTDLHNLLDDSKLQTALLTNPNTTHPSIPASQVQLKELLESNLQLSNNLLTLESTLHKKRGETQSRLLALKAQEQQHRAKIEETERALQQFSPMALYQRLSASVGEQEALVRGVEESWLEDKGYGDVGVNGYSGGEGGVASTAEVESFVRRVKEARKVGFLRKERKARWDEGRVGGWR